MSRLYAGVLKSRLSCKQHCERWCASLTVASCLNIRRRSSVGNLSKDCVIAADCYRLVDEDGD